MNCPNVKFDTENLFSNPCSCSQQKIELDDMTRLRLGNNTGFERILYNFIIYVFVPPPIFLPHTETGGGHKFAT